MPRQQTVEYAQTVTKPLSISIQIKINLIKLSLSLFFHIKHLPIFLQAINKTDLITFHRIKSCKITFLISLTSFFLSSRNHPKIPSILQSQVIKWSDWVDTKTIISNSLISSSTVTTNHVYKPPTNNTTKKEEFKNVNLIFSLFGWI